MAELSCRSKLKVPNLKSQIPNSKGEIRTPKSKVPNQKNAFLVPPLGDLGGQKTKSKICNSSQLQQ